MKKQLSSKPAPVQLQDWEARWKGVAATIRAIRAVSSGNRVLAADVQFYQKHYGWFFSNKDIYITMHRPTLPESQKKPDPPLAGLTEMQQIAVDSSMRWAMGEVEWIRAVADQAAARLGYMNVRRNSSDEVIGRDCGEQLPGQVAGYGGELRGLRMVWELFSTYVPLEQLERGRGALPLNFVEHPGPGVLYEWHMHHRAALDNSLREVAQKHSLDWLELASKISVLHYEWYKFYARGPLDEDTRADLNLLHETSTCLCPWASALTTSGLPRGPFGLQNPGTQVVPLVRRRGGL